MGKHKRQVNLIENKNASSFLCPFVRANTAYTASPDPDDAYEACEGDMCMAWRYSAYTNELGFRVCVEESSLGYCGAAGKPV